MNHERTLVRLSKLAQKSGVRVKFKDQSKLMVALSKVLFFKPDFLTETVTVWGDTLYYPSRDWMRQHPEKCWRSMAHGLVHISDMRRWTAPVYVLSYLFPQCLALLALASLYFPWMLLFILALLPWPAPFRKHWEMRACAMTLATELWQDKEIDFSSLSNHFVSGHYYWCWPFQKAVLADLHGWASRAKAKKLGLLLPHTSDVKFSIRIEGVLR